MLHPHNLQRAQEQATAEALDKVATAIEKLASEQTDNQGRETEMADLLNRLAYKIRYPE